jgi:RNA recognition motif-containing protein
MEAPQMPQNMPPPFQGLGNGSISHSHLRGGHDISHLGHSELDEELIPTAIVIKNIPFAVKKEQLVQLMTEMGLPLPYAFNYHFDNGIFRGLAFANFTTADETAAVIDAMNHYELCGRKLRVEYKKMLPLIERERIEREKREKRGQLQEQHQPMSGQLHSQPSMSSISSNIPGTSPSPLSARNQKPGKRIASPVRPPYSNLPEEYDFNDPQVLRFYSQLLLFKEDLARDTFTFPPTLSPTERRIVHTLAHQMELAHVSKGTGDQRAVHIFRVNNALNVSPPIPQMPTSHPSDTHRRALNRAATTDFSDVRAEGFYGTLGRQSSGLLGFPDSPGGLTASHNLRAAKSYADLRSYTPSPVPSTASFPAISNNNFARFAEYASNSSAASNPNLSATAASMANRDDMLINGMNNMTIGNGFGQSGSPRSIRNAWDREAPGPIGGHRSFSSAQFDDSRDRNQGLPARQPRGPLPERGTGFPSRSTRQNGGHSGRGSDDISSQSNLEITVE